LAALRVNEASKALAMLGSRVYIRLGLKNHPYNGIADEISLEQVLQVWGGEAHLIAAVIELIDHFKPQVVVSPDQHSEAREHFEHEAVGYIIRRALEVLRNRGEDNIRGHLVSVDPLQRHKYTDTVGLSALDPGKGIYWRNVQARALKAHRTQRDAAVIGLERLPNFAREYYQTQFWALTESVESFFK
jgi:LmbE family N-acetylglucosaminyl deacetylase